MKKCNICSSLLPDEASFCTNCGVPVEEEFPQTTILSETDYPDIAQSVLTDNDVTEETIVLTQDESEETTVLNLKDVPIYMPNPAPITPIKQKKQLGIGAVIAIVLVVALVIAGISVVTVIALKNRHFEHPDNDAQASAVYGSDNDVNIVSYTFEEVDSRFYDALLYVDADAIDTYVIPYADEIQADLYNGYSDGNKGVLNFIDSTMNCVTGKKLFDWSLDTYYAEVIEDTDFSFDLQLKYYSNDNTYDTYYDEVNNDLIALEEIINEVFLSHGLDSVSVENYIYKLYVFNDENGNYVSECEVAMVETSQGCFILGFE